MTISPGSVNIFISLYNRANESTIYEMTGVNADNVKEIFMSKLNNSKETTNKNETSKTGKTRKSRKKIFLPPR